MLSTQVDSTERVNATVQAILKGKGTPIPIVVEPASVNNC